jgi:tetratricopeptide (TPR) repeat protein
LFNGIHEKIASIHFEIGCVLSELGDLKESLHHFQLCLFKRRKLLGIHVDVATVLLEISSIYTYYNDFESAASCLEESDRIWKTKLRGNDEKLTSVLVLSGKRWKTIQCYKEAEANLEQALEMSITMHGQNHDLVAEILLDLGELLQEIPQIQQVSNRNVCIQYFFDKLVPMSLPSGFFLF